MPDDDICGSTDTHDGEPCQNPAGHGMDSDIGPCWRHDPSHDGDQGGRPAFIDDEAAKERLYEAVEDGLYLNHAAAYARYSYDTVKAARDKGEEHLRQGKETKFSEFSEELDAREAAGIKKRMGEVSPEHFVAVKGYAKTERREHLVDDEADLTEAAFEFEYGDE